MRILWITTRPPYPPNSGGKIAVYYRIAALHERGHRIHLVAPRETDNPEAENAAVAPLRQRCETVTMFRRRRALLSAGVGGLLRLPWGALSRLPPADSLRRAAECAQMCDLVLVEHSVMFPLARRIVDCGRPLPIVVNIHSDGFAALDRVARDRGAPLFQRLTSRLEAKRSKRLDDRIARDPRAQQLLFVSSAQHMEACARHPEHASRFHYLPIALAIDEEPPQSAGGVADDGTLDLLLIASFNDRGNALAARWLIDEVLPRIPQEARVRLNLVGRHADSLGDGFDERVRIVNNPPSVEPVYETADVCLVPARAGSGVRVKLLEAIERHKPVISTRLGVEGTVFADREDVLIADTAEAFAHAIVEVASEPEAAARRARSARQKLGEHHAIGPVADALETVLERALNAPTRGGGAQ